MRLTTLIKSFFYLSLVLITGALIGVIFFGLENSARIKDRSELSAENIKRARQLIKEHEPEKVKAGQERSISVREDDMNLVFHYFLSRIPGGKKVGTNIDLEPESADFACTFELPKNSFRSYLNISVGIAKSGRDTKVEFVRVGKIEFVGLMAKPILPVMTFAIKKLEGYSELAEAADAVKDYQFSRDMLSLVYEWRPETVEKLAQKGREMMISEEDRERLFIYNEHLSSFSNEVSGNNFSLSIIMEPVFSLAQERTAVTKEPILENQAAITVLAFFVLKKPVSLLVGENASGAVVHPRAINVTLRGRQDLAKHFMLSAAIAATADSSLANAIGLFKELDDSRGGSGFSFADLAADRAGVRFGVLGTADSREALQLQELMSNDTEEAEFMPRIDRLPESMQETEFKLRYNDLDSAAYGEVKDEIERRITACRIFH